MGLREDARAKAATVEALPDDLERAADAREHAVGDSVAVGGIEFTKHADGPFPANGNGRHGVPDTHVYDPAAKTYLEPGANPGALVRQEAPAEPVRRAPFVVQGTPLHLTPQQHAFLLRPISGNRVKQLRGQHHLEAWDVRRTLTRAFGFGGWDLETIDLTLVREIEHPPGATKVARWNNGNRVMTPNESTIWTVVYRAQVRLTIKNPDGTPGAVFEDGASGDSVNQPSLGDAHDQAMKGLALTTPIPTPTGWTTMGELIPGDHVLDRDGVTVSVRAVSKVKEIGCYRVTFRNGESIICDEEHLWVARVAQGKERVHTVGDLAAALAAGKPVVITPAAPVELPTAQLPLDPWVLGYWLGNGSRATATVTCDVDDAYEIETMIRSAGYEVGEVRRDPRSRAVSIRIKEIVKTLADMGLLGNKHVPDLYLRGSIEQRRALLAGLMDSDGTVSGGTQVRFDGTDAGLVRAVAEVARTLGEKVRVGSHPATGYGKTVTAHRAEWTPIAVPFALPRKARKTRTRVKRSWHAIASIETVPTVPTRCISVDSPSRTYLAGESMVPTHNTALSQGLKRCAVNLGDQFGMSLYNGGSYDAVVIGTLAGPVVEGGETVEALTSSAPVRGEQETPEYMSDPGQHGDADPDTGLPTPSALRDEAVDPGTGLDRLRAIYAMVHRSKGTHPAYGPTRTTNENNGDEALDHLVHRKIQEAKERLK